MLCYECCVLFVNGKCELSLDSTMKLTGTVHSFAMREEYLIGFAPDLVQVRIIETGELLQTIIGKDIRCVDDAQTGDNNIKLVMQHPVSENIQVLVELIL